MTDEKQVPWLCTARVALALIGCLGFINLYAMRVNMSVAIVCMINHTAVELKSQNDLELLNNLSMSNGAISQANHYNNKTGSMAESDEEQCGQSGGKKGSASDGEFDWDKSIQGIVLGAFFWGYLTMQIPGGLLSQKYGPRKVMGICMIVASLATLFISISARTSPYLLIALRVLTGMGEGVVFPSMHNLWAKWAPPLERTRLIGFTHAGAQIGNVLTMPISALLCDYGFDGGWSSIFYLSGIFGLLWCVMWLLCVADTPAQHPRITESEKRYIETSLGSNNRHISLSETPWLMFAKSKPFWAIIVAHVCCNWGNYCLLTSMPGYMKEVLKFDIKSNGLFSAIPYVVYWLVINIGGVSADALRTRGWSTKLVRKILLTLSCIPPGILLIVTGYIPCTHPYIAVGVLSLAVGLSGFHFSSVLVNHIDIAPPFAGTMFGISNTLATIPGFLSPYVVKLITVNSAPEEWQIVFYITGAIYLFGAIFYCIFADGEVQDWALPYMMNKPETSMDEERQLQPLRSKDKGEQNNFH